MQLIKDMTKYKDQVELLYKKCFHNDDLCWKYDFNSVTNLNKCYGLVDKNNKLVSFVAVVDRKIIKAGNEYNIALLGCLMTDLEFRGNNYGIELINHVAEICVQEYDSVVLQSENWEIYKSLDLVTSTIKKEFEYVVGEYPTPMLMTWNEPNPNLIADIESSDDETKTGLIRPLSEINDNIKMLKQFNYKFISNPFAYIWYDESGKIELMSYNSIFQLTWIMHQVSPKKPFLLFDEPGLDDIPCLKKTGREIIITKTFKGSKHFFNNLKLPDFEL